MKEKKTEGRALFWLVLPLARLILRKYSFCTDRVPDLDGPFLMLANHTTEQDFLMAACAARKPLRFVCDENCFHLDKMTVFPLEGNQVLPLTHGLFDDDAIFLQNATRGVTLCSDKSAHSVHLAFPDSPCLGIWHTPKSDAPFVCIEPWVQNPAPAGVVAQLMEKPDAIKLEPAAVYRNTYVITCK